LLHFDQTSRKAVLTDESNRLAGRKIPKSEECTKHYTDSRSRGLRIV